MADPLSVAASVAGLISLASEVTKIITKYVSDAKSAHEDANILIKELGTFQFVLEQFKEFVYSGQVPQACFNDTSILIATVSFSHSQMTDLYKKLQKTSTTNSNKVLEVFERMKWPLRKDDCEKSV
jgi:hypothetical protein